MKWLHGWRGYAVVAVMVVLAAVAGLAPEALGDCPPDNCDADTETEGTSPCKTASGCNSDCDGVKCSTCDSGPCPDSTVSCSCHFVHQVVEEISDGSCASGYRCHCLIECHYNPT
jgi:hypothetical protein